MKNTTKILSLLAKTYPNAICTLTYKNPLHLLIATILSAQCTDERVNKITPGLFQNYPNAQAFARAPLHVLEHAVHSTGFYKNKAKAIKNACAIIALKHKGSVPKTMEELLTLPGVARKTANVVLGNAFGIQEGMVVDTHVKRLAQRLGWTKYNSPEKIEQDLMRRVPQHEWIATSHRLIAHGRAICIARKPNCAACPLRTLCPSAFRV